MTISSHRNVGCMSDTGIVSTWNASLRADNNELSMVWLLNSWARRATVLSPDSIEIVCTSGPIASGTYAKSEPVIGNS